MLLILLMAVSFLAYPGWVLDFLRATWTGIKAVEGLTAGGILAGYWPAAGVRIGWGLTAALIVLLGVEWAGAVRGDFRRFAWAACLTLAATPLIGFRTGISNLEVLLPAFALFLAVAFERWSRAGYLLVVGLILLVLALPWMAYLQGRVFDLPAEGLLLLFYPILTLLGLYWTRWWAIHPPRTLMDQVEHPVAQ
jgi:hypothetical protein